MKNGIILIICTTLLLSCGGQKKKNQESENSSTTQSTTSTNVDTHNAQNSLDYMGYYHGVLPTASGEGMDVCITLNDSIYTKKMVYIGKSEEPIISTGPYSWNNEGNTITLHNEEKPNQYFVGENTLTHLDMDGNKIEGELADKYILKKE
ncbi:MAG: copper resistance protein NlpE [Prevotellaceae bacterium]|jgi:uncharacterized lipoprotein NlpE involved in copper resistance|nr:copper resistance protein NlpE [Prevotellaceae bacterium]